MQEVKYRQKLSAGSGVKITYDSADQGVQIGF